MDPGGSGKFRKVPEISGMFPSDWTGKFRKSPESSGIFRKAPESSGNSRKAPESSGKLQKAPESSGKFRIKADREVPERSGQFRFPSAPFDPASAPVAGGKWGRSDPGQSLLFVRQRHLGYIWSWPESSAARAFRAAAPRHRDLGRRSRGGAASWERPAGGGQLGG